MSPPSQPWQQAAPNTIAENSLQQHHLPSPTALVGIPTPRYEDWIKVQQDSSQTGTVVSKIEDILNSVSRDVSNIAQKLSIPFKSRPKKRSRNGSILAPEIGQNGNLELSDDTTSTLYFPGKSERQARKFSRFLFLPCSTGLLPSLLFPG